MKVLCAGGGSGGHVTPVVAVINEIAKREPNVDILFVCDKAFEEQARGLMKKNAVVPVETAVITAGKLRRYQHLSFWQHLTVPGLVFSNIVDMFKVVFGVVQSVALFTSFRPDVVFAKGGYVCLPIGIAARLFSVPLVIHDSDARAGMTNGIISRWALKISTGSPLENYSYPASRSVYVGVPIAEEFHPYSDEEQNEAKEKLGFSSNTKLVVVTGGGLGAVTINEAIVEIAPQLMSQNIALMHVTGKKHFDSINEQAVKDPLYKIVPFVFSDMAGVLGAADVVVSRASATFSQELAGLAKPSILIPSRALGDQKKNAAVFKNANAAVVLTDDDIENPEQLLTAITKLISDRNYAQSLAQTLHSFARPHAASDVAELVVGAVKR